MEKIGLVLEGGASRGVFTAGVLDYWMEQGITFPYVVGVSAGACNAADLVSKQIGRTRNTMIHKDKKYEYMAADIFQNPSAHGYGFDLPYIPGRILPL